MIVSHRQPVDPTAASHRNPSPHNRNLSAVYAVPAPRGFKRDGDSGARGLSYAEHELLRSRKTPYGRIDEQFEVSSLDKNIHIPASKHVLLSISPPRHVGIKHYDGSPGIVRNQPRNPTEAMGQQVRAAMVGQYPPQAPMNGPHFAWKDFGGVDSAIQQTMTLQDPNYYYHPGSQVPTVLPSAFHTHLGPTAPASQQYYGPYWPDGTFSPYRPAPVRDSRFFGDNTTFIESQSVPNNRPLRRPGRLPLTRDVNFIFPDHEDMKSKAAPGSLPFYDRLPTSTANREMSQSNLARDLSCIPSATDARQLGYYPPSMLGSSQQHIGLRPSTASDEIAFRDRTFSWAHHVYVELLTKIQRENKLGRPPSIAHGYTKMVTKPTIFPKPPQRSGAYFMEPGAPARKSQRRENGSDLNFRSRQFDESDTRPRTAIHSPQQRTSDYKPGSISSLPQITKLVPPHELRLGQGSTRRATDPYVYQPPNCQCPPEPVLAAASALGTMEFLCEEAEIPWTDGMLLAGCLAYGLGNYAKALTWYQRILSQDSKHVEAISNLAATLLALGRRDEALHHWSTAVRMRPSYFEAVEHLIGLLCTAHRARDAVDMIEYVQSCLKSLGFGDIPSSCDSMSDGGSDAQSRSSSITTTASNEQGVFEYDMERRASLGSAISGQQAAGFGSSGYAVSGSDNGRLLALLHAKGNMLYGLGDNSAAAASFEDAILIATGHRESGIRGLIKHILHSCVSRVDHYPSSVLDHQSREPILLSPERAQQTAQRMFPPSGELPGLEFVQKGLAYKAAISTTSNSLLSLAKIYQDGMGDTFTGSERRTNGTREILALYYLSLSLQRSPSTANNVGILLASVQQPAHIQVVPQCANNHIVNYAGIAPGSGVALALQYYNYGLNIDPRHAHLYTNLGSLLKDLGQLGSAIKMYEIAVQCDGNFDIALANLANAVKDQGRIADAITFYRRAVQANPEFAEAVCGLATALNSVCNWYGRGGVYADGGSRDRFHVDESGKILEASKGSGWINRVVEIVDKQLQDGESWGIGTLTPNTIEQLCQQLVNCKAHLSNDIQQKFCQRLRNTLQDWRGRRWEGARIVRLIERAIRQIGWQWYQDRYKNGREFSPRRYARPAFPATLSSPTAPTVLPFHTFTTPLSAKQVRQISQRNALRISVSALRSSWLPDTVYPPPRPPSPCLNVGYVSSDFNNHPLAHLMQSIFGMHDLSRVRAFCYATTASDGSTHRQQIEHEAPVFHDASTWNVEKLVGQIVKDGIHILVNLNGYTRGAKNEVFAARPAPIQMSFMGFAGTLGAEWCDYIFADSISVPPGTLSPWRRNVDIEDRLHPDALVEDRDDWIYAENIIFAKSTFFCVDHKQSAPDAETGIPTYADRASRDAIWWAEQDRRWRLRKELFPMLSDKAVILGNFNQLYKIDPSTFRMYLRILTRVPNAILWLLRFPDIGEQNLKAFACDWAGEDVASRIVFTDVAPKGTHIIRASVVDLFLDTPECNPHTTAADGSWSGTPLVTWARWDYKMCSRMASSIVASALPEGPRGDEARDELLVRSDEQYEQQAVCLASGLRYYACDGVAGHGRGRLMDLRRILWEGRWTSRLFDTKRWVRDLEDAYWKAWGKWERGEGGDIWL